MSIFRAFDISASGMTAQRFRTDIIAENVANETTTRTQDGTPYRRKVVAFEEKRITDFSHVLDSVRESDKMIGNGVKVKAIGEDYSSDFIMKYDPSHPDADENGYVSYPNVNIVTEMTNMIDASRSYEANVTAFNAIKSMASQGLNVGSKG
ncbi:MAG: flagellar basal body rod protein FlgC [Lachnospiraceae bacterium]|nr:flagellar basal body rod protein FlgC [Lachnospiraceae bacterium]